MCGADVHPVSVVLPGLGSSPRVRSRHGPQPSQPGVEGIISACAEQTSLTWRSTTLTTDHLRVCGADSCTCDSQRVVLGSSPRVRSRLMHGCHIQGRHGIISACAEQTCRLRLCSIVAWDHLRVCGADTRTATTTATMMGSSPRVRSRRRPRRLCGPQRRIISACAEQTGSDASPRRAGEDHLRVCGADPLASPVGKVWEGSSPRVRSRPIANHVQNFRVGIISACAEQTFHRMEPHQDAPDHLRVCGADQTGVANTMRYLGSSPRVRSRLSVLAFVYDFPGIISACAEQTAPR